MATVSRLTLVAAIGFLCALLLCQICNAQSASPSIITQSTASPTATKTTPPTPTTTMPTKATTSKSCGYVTFSVSLLIGAAFVALKMRH